MILIHKDCGGVCHIDLGSMVKIKASPYIDKSGNLKADNISITAVNSKIKGEDIRLFCEDCEQILSIEDSVGYCGYCRKQFKITELVANKECGDILCKKCNSSKEFFDKDTSTPLSKVFSSIKLT